MSEKKLNALMENGEYEKAMVLADELLASDGKRAEIVAIKVSAAIELGCLDVAENAVNDLIALLPTDAYARFLQLRVRFMRGERDFQSDLKDILQKGKTLQPVLREKIYNLLGQCCRFFGDSAGAVSAYQQAAELADTQELKAIEYSNALFNLHYCENNEKKTQQLTEKYNALFAKVPQFFHGPEKKREKIRIGYISADIREHVVLKFCYALFRSYNRDKFEVYCYARNYEDGYSRKVMELVDVWRNVTGQSAADIARIIYNDDIDILIDLSGHTQGNSLPVLAYKPAPVQLSGIGYFATTGLKTIDYFLSDGWLYGNGEQTEITIESVSDFTEKLLVLPRTHFCYLPFGGLPEVSTAPCLKNGYVTVGSFNNFTKLTKRVLQVWRKILDRVPNSRLLLKCEVFNREDNKQVAKERLASAGIDLTKVECRGITRDYMAEYADIDIALDTFPYPGGGTTMDALYMGVPVISLSGRSHGERFGSSILNNLGLGEFCAATEEEYIERAVAIAGDVELINALHQSLRGLMKRSPLMDEQGYVSDFEAGLEFIWEKHKEKKNVLTIKEISFLLPKMKQLLVEKDYRQAVELANAIAKGKYLDSHTLEELAAVYIDGKETDEAEKITKLLAEKKPNDGYALFLRARASLLRNEYELAEQYAEKALATGNLREYDLTLTYDVLGKACKESGQAEKGLAAYWEAIKHADTKDAIRQNFDNYLLTLHYTEADGTLLRQRAAEYNELYANIVRYQHVRIQRHNRIRIGYISADFGRHVMSNFSRGLLKYYDPLAFEVYAYYTGRTYDSITEEFSTYPDVWKDISRLSDEEAAKVIFDDEIDILVDLNGHTQNNRLGVFAYKPAPVQISGIGYMSTTGLTAIDYFIVDANIADIDVSQEFTEQLLVLPHSHFLYCPVDGPAVTEPAPCGHNGYITFGCFNNFTKVTDEMLGLWAKILDKIAGAKLFLKAAAFDDVPSRKRAEKRISAAGISLDRVIFEGWSNYYYNSYNQVDIALDTYPYPGGGTTCDALYMGVPVISLCGKRHGTRFGLSLLSNVGLADLCVKNGEEYVAKAVALAEDMVRLKELHLTLRRRLLSSVLGNAELYMAELELEYIRIWQAYISDKENVERVLQELQTAVDNTDWQKVLKLGQAAYVINRDKENNGKIASAVAMAYYGLKSERRTSFWAEKALLAKNTYLTKPELFVIAERGYSKTAQFLKAREAAEHAKKAFVSTKLKMAPNTATAVGTAVSHTHFVFGLPTAVDNYRETMKNDTDGLAHKASMYSSMLLSMHLSNVDAAEMFAAHRGYQELFTGIKPYTHNKHKKHSKLRIGYISPDFRKHVMYTFIFPLLANYNREEFEVYCYSLGEKKDEYTRLLQSFVDNWRDLTGTEITQQAEIIYNDEIDILFDLAGHSTGSGLPALAYKPAPVQLSGLGYMDTTGLDAVDYYVADEEAVSNEAEQWFSEKILRLPTMFCSAGREENAESDGAPVKKNGYIVFGVFNNYRKYQNDVLLAWKMILEQVPNSRLLLKCDFYIDSLATDFAYNRFKALGFDMERVYFEPASFDYLNRYLAVDVALDTYPWPGGGTTVDALYMGVPVVSLYGARFGARFGLSILTAAGLKELAVNNLDDYIARAVELARDVETLDVLHKNLRKMVKNSLLFDSQHYVQMLEENYKKIWREYEETGRK